MLSAWTSATYRSPRFVSETSAFQNASIMTHRCLVWCRREHRRVAVWDMRSCHKSWGAENVELLGGYSGILEMPQQPIFCINQFTVKWYSIANPKVDAYISEIVEKYDVSRNKRVYGVRSPEGWHQENDETSVAVGEGQARGQSWGVWERLRGNGSTRVHATAHFGLHRSSKHVSRKNTCSTGLRFVVGGKAGVGGHDDNRSKLQSLPVLCKHLGVALPYIILFYSTMQMA